MQPKRLSVKFFLRDAPEIDGEKVVAVFQRWIQRTMVEGLLIDVADYKHVIDGPGVVLIGDEGDYAFNLNDGRPGIHYTRKRQLSESLQGSLRTTFRLAAIAGQKFSAERAIGNPAVDYTEAEIVFLDRLNVPNTRESFAALSDEISVFARSLYAGSTVTVESAHADPRECLAVRIISDGQIDSETLIERLTAEETVSE